MTNEHFLQIISGVITILMALVSAYVIPWLKSRIDDVQLQQINSYIELAVRCANQIYTPEQWQEKKRYVTSYITELINDKFSLTLNSVDIDTLIEGKVNEVKNGNR